MYPMKLGVGTRYVYDVDARAARQESTEPKIRSAEYATQKGFHCGAVIAASI
jgi:hypothetical protein